MQVSTPTGESEVYRPPFNISDVGLPEPHVPDLDEDRTGLVQRLLRRTGKD